METTTIKNTFNGVNVKSITFTKSATILNQHNNTMVINMHAIKGVSKDDCINEFNNNKQKYDDKGNFNNITYFLSI